MNYRHITFAENQACAYEILRIHGISEKDDLPIDPELILRKIEIDVVPYPGLTFKFGAQGFVTKINGAFQVWVDENHYYHHPDSSLLTIGEELGHIKLHLESVDNISSIEEWIKQVVATEEYYAFMEQQAKTFSSHIILPSFSFNPYVLEWIDHNIGRVRKLKSPNHKELAYAIASIMAKDLGISEYIIEITLNRWPDPAIFKIMQAYPDLMSEAARK